ncbi:hypothetical protein TOPH_08357 [Tolypocladium ophioglossoides CBS 100239]|uniref:WSC domain-containing protein n=1 Tax=Tolypocladium ophioglossoides (strain CBS 100239) TaxID=1163406 RepID=A0A0L0MYS7_TOLOC|nr:hypothetical protein TOPH_08357 [Tolypocladium ophioglossoides CBS 100239]
MAVALVLAILGVANVLAQLDHSTSAFTYHGCSSVDVSCFGRPIVFSDGRLTPEACQAACLGHHFAALFPDACRCGDDASAITPVDESACDHPCMGNPAIGSCGGVCPKEGPGIANVYGGTGSSRQGPEPVTVRPVNTAPPAPAADTSCSTLKQTASANPPVATFISPAGPAPEAPTSFPFFTPQGPAPPIPSFPPNSQTGPAPTPPCSQEGDSASLVPTPSTQAPQFSPNEAPEPPSYGIPDTSSPDATAGPSPPEYSPKGQSPPPPGTYSNPDSPGGGSGEAPPTETNCTTPAAPELSTYPSESTLWPRPSDTFDPEGHPPVPSQVPGSDSTHSLIPPFSTIGGLALIAAMIM